MTILIYLFLTFIGGFAGTGVYGHFTDPNVYQGGGSETLATIYAMLTTVALPLLKLFAPKWVPVLQKVLEALSILTPKDTQELTRDDLKEFLDAQAKVQAIATKLGCNKAIEALSAGESCALKLFNERLNDIDWKKEEATEEVE